MPRAASRLSRTQTPSGSPRAGLRAGSGDRMSAKYSVIIPVYRNEASLETLLDELAGLNEALGDRLEVVFVVDGSPDGSFPLLRTRLGTSPFSSQLILHARNFGSVPAVRVGLAAARGDYFTTLAADLQEPTLLPLELFRMLEKGEVDVVLGAREARDDPWLSAIFSNLFWTLYRWLIVPQLPKGGVDLFGCNAKVRDVLVSFRENNSALVGLLFWVGFRRGLIPYRRRPRPHGKSAWSVRAKVRYMLDSIYAFSDLPIRVLTSIGAIALVVAILFGAAVAIARTMGLISVTGYAATVLIITFFGGLNTLGLGILGGYIWRAYENTKQRPFAVVASHDMFDRVAAQKSAT
jgi:glycosyltransferase involved in cell wall biosynthesis